jgi:hypothetical protein
MESPKGLGRTNRLVTPEFEGADYSLESMVRKFVKAPMVAYKPKKGGETDPEMGKCERSAPRCHGITTSNTSM